MKEWNQKVITLIESNEDWLMERVLKYAKERNYTQYTSTLVEAWRLSISGLSKALILGLSKPKVTLELEPNENYQNDPICDFSIVEAQNHRKRGVSLDMFLGLMKYYKQSYIDLHKKGDFTLEESEKYCYWITRLFDRIEIAFSSEWVAINSDMQIEELQSRNRKMTNEKNRYLTIFESIPQPIFILDKNDDILNLNYAASGLLNGNAIPGHHYYDKEKTLIGNPFLECFPWLTKIFIDFIKSENQYITTEWKGENGYSTHIYNVKFSKILDISEKFQGTIIIFEDITNEKRMTKELENAKIAAEAANKAKSVFVANMSHEFRTPLNTIIGFTQLMIREGLSHFEKVSENQFETLNHINSSAEHLLTLINSVLDLSKIEAKKMSIHNSKIDFDQFIDIIEDMFDLTAKEKEIHFNVIKNISVPHYISIDHMKLRQILINLLNNALKFTEKGSITLKIAAEPKDEKGICNITFFVIDSGIGISQKNIKKICDPFVQNENPAKYYEGSGLGLTITKNFIELLGGHLSIESQIRKGTTMSFTIPVEEVSKIKTIEKTGPPIIGLKPEQKKYRILVVDDKKANCELMKRVLEPIGFEVNQVYNGKEAVEIWNEWRPHLIFMDMRMPVMNGFDATVKIKQLDINKETIIIASTASSFDEGGSDYLTCGCDDFIRKPFREIELFNMIEKHLNVQYEYYKGTLNHTNLGCPNGMSETKKKRLQLLPRKIKEELKAAIKIIDPDQINRIIGEIQKLDPTIASCLENMVNNFQHEKILELIQEE